MIATFAYDKNTSPINTLPNAQIIRHEPTQYMSLCQFNNAYWEFDKNKNYAPYIVFEGSIERLDAIDKKFPGNVDTVYFTQNKPTVQFKYNLDEDQLAELAKKGFWSEDGVNMPAVFTTAKFQLETYAVVEEIMNDKENRKVPLFNVELTKPYSNEFDSTAYELIDKISRRKPEESKVIERSVQDDFQQSIAAEVEAIKASIAAMTERDSAASQSEFKPLTEAELDIHNKSANIEASVVAERDALKSIREAGNARAEAERAAERARAEAEQTALTDYGNKSIGDEKVVAVETEITKLTGGVEEDKYASNSDIFNSVDIDDGEIPDKAAALMKELGADLSDKTATIDKKDDKRDDGSGSGAASGTQGLGVYTFEDQSTAQFEMRADEGKGNEKPSDENEPVDEDDKKSNVPDMDERKAKLATSVNDASVDVDTKTDKSDRSK